VNESENELTLSPTIRGSAMRRQLINQFNNQLNSQSSIQPNSQAAEPLGTGKKRKNDSPLKQSERFTVHMDPTKNIERAIEMLSISCDLVTEEENSLLKQIIKQIEQVLHKTTPESTPEPTPKPTPEPACTGTPTTEMNNNLTTILKAIDSLGVRIGQVKSSLAATSSIGSMASQSGITNIGTNSWAAAASFKGSTSNKNTTTPNEQTNNGFATVQYPLTNNGFTTVQNPLRNQPKATSRNFTNQRLILIRSRNNNWQKDIKTTRNKLNKEMQAKLNSQQPVIASITKASYSENVILIATLRFTAQDLLKHKEVIQSIFKCERMQKDIQ
jgi:hypothetical protein